jgi:hypothetical protein
MQDKILGVKRFQLYSDKHFISINKKNDVYLDRSTYLCNIEDAFYIYRWKEVLVISDIYGKTFIVEKDFKLNEFLNLEYSVSNIINNYAIIYKDYNEKTYYGVYDFVKEKILFETEIGIGGSIYNDKMYFTRYEDIISFGIKEEKILWQFSISDFPPYKSHRGEEIKADIKQIIGVYNNILWVYIGEWHLVGLDVNTGEKVHHIENMLELLGLNRKERLFGLDDTIHLNEQQGILKFFGFRYYFEIDLNTLQGKVKKDFGEDCFLNWRIRYSNYYQEYPDLLFFCGYFQEIHSPNAFGIFDTEKAEIIWSETTKDDLGYFYNPPQANDKLLAVLDDKHNLLVYERD